LKEHRSRRMLDGWTIRIIPIIVYRLTLKVLPNRNQNNHIVS
jgi:hypothetical protein